MNEFNERIIQIADYYSVTRASDFSRKTGFSHQTASNYLKGSRIPTAESLKIIKQVFDLINAEWLLTGKGEMIRTEQTVKNVYCPDCINKDKLILDLQSKLIKCQEETIQIIKSQSK
jgi:transcriptional regulator with XRE-family HTH domain